MRGLIGFIILAAIFAYTAHAETEIRCKPVIVVRYHCYNVMGEPLTHRPPRCDNV